MITASDSPPTIARIPDLPALLEKKSHFLLGPRQTGKTFLIRHALKGARVYDLLDSSIYLALSHMLALAEEQNLKRYLCVSLEPRPHHGR